MEKDVQLQSLSTGPEGLTATPEPQLELDSHGLALEAVMEKLGVTDEEDVKKLMRTKRPIFIATVEKEIINQLVTLLGNNPHTRDLDFEVLVLGNDMFQGLYADYLLKQLDSELQSKLRAVKTEKHYREGATAQAVQLETMLQKYFTTQQDGKLTVRQIEFTESELRSMLKKEGKDLSHAAVWEIIDMFVMFNLATLRPDFVDKPKHLHKYTLTVQPEVQLTYQEVLRDGLQSTIENSKRQLKIVNEQIKNANKQLKKNASKSPIKSSYTATPAEQSSASTDDGADSRTE